ncbi:cupin domain-containing protein [Pseudanabaena mucicola]|uniref:Cupin domain-containing protein n=1 Tax=Pseudanabaena mucicola FACHB-723 TaxID=2692860 RepID=A0ABR7ZWG9_9CYAN|nr:cupin domain-containing protein [Pseudanabaena mucicola]MBD2188306.1 cupin domain-containing protein [Pseudanabaena mucicola FACHB-723]
MNNPNVEQLCDVSSPDQIITVRPAQATDTVQRLPYFVGISGTTAGAKGISMNLVIIPAGSAAEPHCHNGYETAIYLLEGKVETRYGKGLKQSVINEAGDFLFIPAGVPHQPHNLSDTHPARAIVSRNDPNEQENVIIYDPNQD